MTSEGTRIAITGAGAVTPAGWGMPLMLESLRNSKPLETTSLCMPGNDESAVYLRREVPKADNKESFLRHPRLRRASSSGRYLAAAAMEAMGDDLKHSVSSGDTRLGIVVSCYTGGINYSQRFYREVLEDPATASPIIFPETVYNAPASHLAALFGSSEINYTLVGDESQFLTALEIGANWLVDDEVDAVLVAAAEENNWLSAEALSLFTRSSVLGEGAAALLLERCESPEVELELITDMFTFTGKCPRKDALHSMRAQLPGGKIAEVLFEGGNEGHLWDSWQGRRISVREIFGEGFGVSVAWACAAAAGLMKSAEVNSALVSGSGMNQACAATLFTGNSSSKTD